MLQQLCVGVQDGGPDTNGREPRDRQVCRRVGSLSALGYPPAWTLGKAGITVARTTGFTPGEADAVGEVYLDYRDQTPGPHLGLDPQQIKDTRALAREWGFKTPDWYDEGTGRALTKQDHRDRVTARNKRERAYTIVEVLTWVIRGMLPEEISRIVGVNEKRVGEWRLHAAGLTGTNTYQGGWAPDPECRSRFREIEAALDRFLADPGADPHLLLVDQLGIIDDPAIDVYRKTVS